MTFPPTPPSSHECLIAISETGASFLINSNPSLYEFALIDNNDSDLQEIVSHDKWDTIPTERGVYKCTIMVAVIAPNNPNDLDHDLNIWISNAVKVMEAS